MRLLRGGSPPRSTSVWVFWCISFEIICTRRRWRFAPLSRGHFRSVGPPGVPKRSLASLSALLSHALTEVQLAVGTPVQTEAFLLATLVADARDAASLYADASGCPFAVPEVDPLLSVTGDRELLWQRW